MPTFISMTPMDDNSSANSFSKSSGMELQPSWVANLGNKVLLGKFVCARYCTDYSSKGARSALRKTDLVVGIDPRKMSPHQDWYHTNCRVYNSKGAG